MMPPRTDVTAAGLDDAARLAAVQRRFDAMRAGIDRTSRGGLLDLSYTHPIVELDPRVRAALVDAASGLTPAELQYSPYGGSVKARRLIATALARRTGAPFRYRDVVLTHGAMAALSLVFASAFEPGDEVLLLRPTWFDHPLYLRTHGLRYRFVALGPGKRLDADALAAAIGPATAGLVISQPQSPTGVVMSDAELSSLAEILASARGRFGRELMLVSDEAHRGTEWRGGPAASPVAFHPHTVIVHSFGKAWRVNGQRIGYAAVGPASASRDQLADRIVQRSRALGFGTPTALMQHVAARLASLEPDLEWLRDAQLFMRSALTAAGYDVVHGDATAFVYARVPNAEEWLFVDALARRGVLALPSALCHESGFFRLALNVAQRALEPAAKILADAARTA